MLTEFEHSTIFPPVFDKLLQVHQKLLCAIGNSADVEVLTGSFNAAMAELKELHGAYAIAYSLAVNAINGKLESNSVFASFLQVSAEVIL